MMLPLICFTLSLQILPDALLPLGGEGDAAASHPASAAEVVGSAFLLRVSPAVQIGRCRTGAAGRTSPRAAPAR
jgi:hypothetical protein